MSVSQHDWRGTNWRIIPSITFIFYVRDLKFREAQRSNHLKNWNELTLQIILSTWFEQNSCNNCISSYKVKFQSLIIVHPKAFVQFGVKFAFSEVLFTRSFFCSTCNSNHIPNNILKSNSFSQKFYIQIQIRVEEMNTAKQYNVYLPSPAAKLWNQKTTLLYNLLPTSNWLLFTKYTEHLIYMNKFKTYIQIYPIL